MKAIYDHDELVALGTSVAGTETCIEVPSLDIGFDIGICTNSSVKLKHIAISHGHMDHIGAIISHACRKQMLKLGPANYYVPVDIVHLVNKMFEIAEEIDGDPIGRSIIPMNEGDVFQMSQNKKLQAFRTDHRVPSFGYRITETRKRLKAEFKDTPPQQFSEMVKRGVQLNEHYDHVPVVYTGDTRIDAFDKNYDLIKDAKTLIMELTFIDEQVPIEKARERGHVHIDEVLARADMFANHRTIFTHFSARYTELQIQDICSRRFADKLKTQTHYL